MIMAGGELCLLLPNRPLNFGDRVRRRPAVPRCLFGPPDHVETEKLLQEEMQKERERFQKRWNVDLDALEAAIQKRESAMRVTTEEVESKVSEEKSESRIPTPSEVEERLSACTLGRKENISRGRVQSSAEYVPCLKRSAVCKKPCRKFQKRVRVAGACKRQTYLTEFWRSRRSLAFVFGKSKVSKVTLQAVTELLDAPISKLD